MVQNPSDSRTVEFTAIYHSSDYEHCEHKQTGVIYNEIIEGNTCFSFPLTQMEELELLITRLDLGEINTAFLLCNNIIDLKKIDGRHKYRIDYSEMQKYCNDKEHKVFLVVVTGVKSTN